MEEAGETTHERLPALSGAGVVGMRMRPDVETPWRPHIPAAELRALIGEDIWRSYLKFTCVRNPYDKAVSMFWWTLRDQAAPATFEEARDAFVRWVTDGGAEQTLDRNIYMIDGAPAVDRFLRYERLWADVSALCAELGIAREPSALGSYKSEVRRRPEPFSAYYNDAAAEAVARVFDWELAHFGYSLSDADAIPFGFAKTAAAQD